MQEAIPQPTGSMEAADPIVAAAIRAEAWAGEPFLREGEDPAEALGEGTARRRALDEAVAEMDAGRTSSVAAMEGPLRTPARPRARARGAGAAHRRRHRAPPPPGRCARRNAHRADRSEPALPRAERQRERQRPHGDGGGARAAAGRGRGRGLDARRRDRERGASRGAAAGRPGRGAPLPLPPPDRIGQDDRRSGLRRGGPHPRRADPHAPAPSGVPVHARPDDRGLRQAPHTR